VEAAAVEKAVRSEVRFCPRLLTADCPPWEERSARKEQRLFRRMVNPGPVPYHEVVHLGLLLRRNQEHPTGIQASVVRPLRLRVARCPGRRRPASVRMGAAGCLAVAGLLALVPQPGCQGERRRGRQALRRREPVRSE
jgi:hypothetical protein